MSSFMFNFEKTHIATHPWVPAIYEKQSFAFGRISLFGLCFSWYLSTTFSNWISIWRRRLAFHPETVENVVPDGSTWPTAANVFKVLHVETVVYSHMLDTSKWTLHPIDLSEKSMTWSVLAAASLNFKTGSSATLQGLLGTMRRHIHPLCSA